MDHSSAPLAIPKSNTLSSTEEFRGLDSLVEELAQLQPKLKEAEENLKAAQMEANRILATPKRERDRIKAEYEELDAKVREATLLNMEQTGEMEPLPGIVIARVKQLVYDPAEARTWAMRFAQTLLVLDEKAFKERCKGQSGVSMPNCAHWETVPQVRISTNILRERERAEMNGSVTVAMLVPDFGKKPELQESADSMLSEGCTCTDMSYPCDYCASGGR